MHRGVLILALLLAASLARPPVVQAAGQARGQAGRFDYYLLALSWSADWCRLTGDARRDPQCDAGRGLGFTLHGLWPQYETGYPLDCPTVAPPPTRRQTAAMADIMGGAGLAWHEWQKHGRCTGLSAQAYFATARAAYDSIALPPVFRRISVAVRLRPSVVVDAFLEANPHLGRDNLMVTCDQGLIQEVRICLTKALQPRPCSTDALAGQCRLPAAAMEPLR